jgi:hypothetical protein
LAHLAGSLGGFGQFASGNLLPFFHAKRGAQGTGLFDRFRNPFFSHYLYLAVFFAIPLGCATNCLPAFLPARFALVVAAYSAGDKDLIAASGKYRSPVLEDGLPDLVRHFWSVQALSDA